ncbi:hypothetical protein [Sorangium atrum]|uniref:Roadblock/LAMTOR2 domain-containing protein n=1 Tax=Sorangium atrum TaxID=2995308 RepID=A0ABT5C5P6_9BACT|nr:hypothetical protein [Sorangium aterium]MDC0681744.1 hypothetical protein [Sorangium aterium]
METTALLSIQLELGSVDISLTNEGERMTRERQVAQALSEGLNCLSAIVESLDGGASASELPANEWLGTLCAMGGAFDAILSKEVTTTLVVRQADRDFVQRLIGLVLEWTTTRQPPQELRTTIESILKIFDRRDAESAPDTQK